MLVSEGQLGTGSLGCLLLTAVLLGGRAEQLRRPQKLQPCSEADSAHMLPVADIFLSHPRNL